MHEYSVYRHVVYAVYVVHSVYAVYVVYAVVVYAVYAQEAQAIGCHIRVCMGLQWKNKDQNFGRITRNKLK